MISAGFAQLRRWLIWYNGRRERVRQCGQENNLRMMTIDIDTLTPENVLELAQKLSASDLRWLREQIEQLLEAETPLPEHATVDEAVALFLAEQCSLGRAAELAGVTRWDIQDILKERGIPIMIYSSKSIEEMDQLAHKLKQEGLLC